RPGWHSANRARSIPPRGVCRGRAVPASSDTSSPARRRACQCAHSGRNALTSRPRLSWSFIFFNANLRTELRQRTPVARRLARETDLPAVINCSVIEHHPIFLRQQFHEVLFDLG